MDYSILAETYERLATVSSKLKKTSLLAELFDQTSSDQLEKISLLVQGRVYPVYSEFELGIANQLMLRAIAKATGLSPVEVEKRFKKTGDLGLTAEECLKRRRQSTLMKRKLTVDFVFRDLQKLATVSGKGSQEKKLNLIAELIVSAQPVEARYIVRTILQDLRVGVAEGIIRDAIVEAFLVKKETTKEERKEARQAVEHAWNILTDFGEVALLAKEKGLAGLRRVKIKPGKPIRVMLGLAAEDIREVVKKFGKIIAQYKYDGMRVIIEKRGNRFWLFTRRLEEVTKQFPDIVEFARKGVKAEECIVEGEALGIDKKSGLPIPFQVLGQRIHRKYDIKKMVKEIPVQVNLFDILYLDGQMLIDKPLIERGQILKKVIRPLPKKFQLAKQIISDDVKELEKFKQEALAAQQEGLMLKVLASPYTFGRHVETMYKIKEVMENLDLVVIAANWGEGTRARWLTSYELACRDPETGKFLSCGMMSTGLTEEGYEQMTKTLRKIIVSEKGKTVKVSPRLVLEVSYQEIQKSPHYDSGFGLRFPRFVRLREDKGPNEADTINRVKKLYASQGRAG